MGHVGSPAFILCDHDPGRIMPEVGSQRIKRFPVIHPGFPPHGHIIFNKSFRTLIIKVQIEIIHLRRNGKKLHMGKLGNTELAGTYKTPVVEKEDMIIFEVYMFPVHGVILRLGRGEPGLCRQFLMRKNRRQLMPATESFGFSFYL